MYGWDGAAWARALAFSGGIIKVAPGNASLATLVTTASGTAYAAACRLHHVGLYANSTGVAQWSLRDGGAAGITKFVIQAPVSGWAFAHFFPPIPFATNLYLVEVAGAGEISVGYSTG